MLARLAATVAAILVLVILVLAIAWPDHSSTPAFESLALQAIDPSTSCAGAILTGTGHPGAPAGTDVLAGGVSRHGEPGRLDTTRQGRTAAGPDASPPVFDASEQRERPVPPRGLPGPDPAWPRAAASGRFQDSNARTAMPGPPISPPEEADALLRRRPAGARDRARDMRPVPLAGGRAAPWTNDQLLANPTNMNDEYVALKASPTTGNLFAVFSAYDLGGSTRDIYISRSLDQGASWTTVKMPTFSLDESMPDLAIDAAGYLYVVWVRGDGVLIRARSAGPEDINNWAYVQGFVVDEPIAVPSIAVSGSGDFARVFIACSWYTINWDWWQYEYTLLWLYSTNGGQTVAYDYLLPDGHQDLWPVVAMHGTTVYMANGEQDPYTGRIRILAAADALSGSFADYIDLTQGSPMSNGFPSIEADGQNVHIVYQLDWDAGPGGIDGDVMYVFSWDGLATAYGPYAIMATESESVGPQITTRGGLVSCVWLEAPPGGDEFHLAARHAPLDGHPDYWGEMEQATDLPMVVTQYRSASVAVGGSVDAGVPDGPLVAVWMDRRDFNIEGFNLYTSRRSLLPNLTPFAPDGWQSPLVVSMVPGQREDGPLAEGYPVYASLAVANLGLANAPGPVEVELRRGGQLVGAWSVSGGLPAGSYAAAEDHQLILSAGLHDLSLHGDAQDLIEESDETDNVLHKDVWVLSGDPQLLLSPSSLYLTAEPESARPLEWRRNDSARDVIEPRLQEILHGTGPKDRLRVVVAPHERPDPADLASRGRHGALRALQERVERFAGIVDEQIRWHGEHPSRGRAERPLRPLWLSGELVGALTPRAIEAVAALPDVGRIWLDDRLSETFAGPAVGRRGSASGIASAAAHAGPDKAAANIPWHLQMLGAAEVWAQGLDGDGILVGHTDSGVAWDHPDLVGRLWDGLPDYPHHGYDFLDDDLDPYDEGTGSFWHGTHTAGLIVGANHGIAPGARVLVTRCVPGYYQDLVEAMQFCLDHGCHLISTSAGWTQPGDDLRSAIRSNAEILLAIGVPWIAAAGNGDNQGGHLPAPFDISSPGDCPEPGYGDGGHSAVIAVGAVAQNRQLWSSSGIGPTAWNVADVPEHADYPYPPGLIKPDLVAPGADVTSTIGGGGYATYSGTSMAAPLVAGAAAILLQADPALSPLDLAEILATTAEDLGPAGRDNQFGAGLVDLTAAVAGLPETTSAVVWAHNLGVVPLIIHSIATEAQWLQPVPASGTVAPGDSLRVVVQWDASGLAEGVHQASIQFGSNDPQGTMHLPVTLSVGQVSSVQEQAPVIQQALHIYPNPFNPGTTVRFDLTADGPFTLRIYDARGRLVRDLLRADRRAGRHEAAWDGRDAEGRLCATGVYLVRLESKAGVRSGRMLMVR